MEVEGPAIPPNPPILGGDEKNERNPVLYDTELGVPAEPLLPGIPNVPPAPPAPPAPTILVIVVPPGTISENGTSNAEANANPPPPLKKLERTIIPPPPPPPPPPPDTVFPFICQAYPFGNKGRTVVYEPTTVKFVVIGSGSLTTFLSQLQLIFINCRVAGS